MEWNLKYAEKVKHYKVLYKRQGLVPESIQDMPELKTGLAWVWDGFMRLNESRPQSGFGVSGLSISDIKNYLDLSGIYDEELREDFFYLISEMDSVFLRKMRDSIKEERDRNKK